MLCGLSGRGLTWWWNGIWYPDYNNGYNNGYSSNNSAFPLMRGHSAAVHPFVLCLICCVTFHVLVHHSQYRQSRTQGMAFLGTYVVEFSCRC